MKSHVEHTSSRPNASTHHHFFLELIIDVETKMLVSTKNVQRLSLDIPSSSEESSLFIYFLNLVPCMHDSARNVDP